MRRILSLSALALVLSGGVAFADRGGGSRDHRGGGGASSHSSRGGGSYNSGGYNSGGYRGGSHNGGFSTRDNHNRGFNNGSTGHVRPVQTYRRNVYLNSGRFDFGGGISHRWSAPIVSSRYYDYRSRPSALAENPQPVAGYLWVPGQWRWSGYEWTWSAGYYQPDPAYQNGGYPPGYGSTDPGYGY